MPSAAGTRQLCDLNAGSASSYSSPLTAADGILYLTANDSKHGFELFRIIGNPAVVERFGASCGIGTPTLDSTQPVLGKIWTFSGTGTAAGVRLLILGVRGVPFGVPGLLAPDCAIWENLALSLVQPLPAGVRWSVPLPIPNQASLIGAKAALQSVHGLLPLSLSNAVQIRLGR